MKLNGVRAGRDFKVVQDKDGKTKVILDTKAKLSRLDLCTRLKVVKSKKMKWKPAR
jgi:hypothetical protein